MTPKFELLIETYSESSSRTCVFTHCFIFVENFSILRNIHNAHQSMGYCPQFDGLDDLLTAAEHLQLYARLRGVPEGDVKQVRQVLLKRLRFTVLLTRDCMWQFDSSHCLIGGVMFCLVACWPSNSTDEPDTVPGQMRRGVQWGKQEEAFYCHCTGRQPTNYLPCKCLAFPTCSNLASRLRESKVIKTRSTKIATV